MCESFTICAIFTTICNKWKRSNPALKYRVCERQIFINYVDGPAMELSGEESGSYISYVVTNTGRTQGTILDIDRGLADERLAVCVPRMDDDGDLVAPGGDVTWSDVVPVNHQFTLQPGQSRLVFMASAKTTPKLLTDGNGNMALTVGEPLTVTGGLRLYLSDGSAETVGADTADPIVAAHYRNLAGYSQVLDYCARMTAR
ncbi:hypothetical protein [Bifidobacterium castoris]|uniref:Uncharacterized protein n=1 Tax=Bifidobacterium castoris TaxID=2306972 RepID=A0A430FAG0_9BIFI|nr:hypothetical protein [Bifidobacterium castoris]RSX49798.1 hypothetical protein D2E22_0259 [Bifidobacterium castoris]